MSSSEELRMRLRQLQKDFQRFDGDTGSTEVQGRSLKSNLRATLPLDKTVLILIAGPAFYPKWAQQTAYSHMTGRKSAKAQH